MTPNPAPAPLTSKEMKAIRAKRANSVDLPGNMADRLIAEVARLKAKVRVLEEEVWQAGDCLMHMTDRAMQAAAENTRLRTIIAHVRRSGLHMDECDCDECSAALKEGK